MALQEILKRFYADFPPHPEEAKYNYVVSSSMKPTQVRLYWLGGIWGGGRAWRFWASGAWPLLL